MLRVVSLLAILLLASACGGSSNIQQATDSPLVRGSSQYFLKNVDVTLKFGHGHRPELELFADQRQLQRDFTDALTRHLKDYRLYARDAASASASLTVEIDYERIFNYGGKALNKPIVSHKVVVTNGDKTLASFAASQYQPKYAYLQQAAVDLQIAAFTWDAEDELKDVDLISEVIVRDIAKLGR